MSTDEQNSKVVAALLRERAGLLGRGFEARVAEVDAELKVRGYEVPEKTEEKPKPQGDPKRQAPQGRTAAPKQTGD